MRTLSPNAAPVAAAVLLFLASAGPSMAGGAGYDDPIVPADSGLPTHEGAEPATIPGSDATAAPVVDTAFGRAIGSDRLDALRGGDGTTTNIIDVRGGVDGNSATNTVSGSNLVQDGSFANAAGISTVIQNSGNNVLIQNSTVVSVQFTDPMP